MDLRGKDVLVIGTKRSGLGAIELLLRQGAHVRAMDSSPLTPEEQQRFAAWNVPVLDQTPANTQGSALIVLSPSVPGDLPLFSEARAHGIPVIGEVELASYFLRGPSIGITGSNGKTTTTALTSHLLVSCGIDCQVGGNIGTAVTTLVETSRDEQWNVLELSSFQLETIHHFEARIAACLNITPDHLDRHGTLDAYVAAKRRLFETQSSLDFAVFNYDDPTCRTLAASTDATVYWFSSSQPVPQGVAAENGQLLFCGQPFMRFADIKLRGGHNAENVMAATAVAALAGAPLESLGPAVASFPGVEHRIEWVRNVSGVDYFNDSKATNVDATMKALQSFDANLWVILGGKDKGSPYIPLRPLLSERAKAALLIGAPPPYPYAAAPLIERDLAGVLPLENCGTLDSAVLYAREHAQPGDVVLLSPACASFDQFTDFEARGRAFKSLVNNL